MKFIYILFVLSFSLTTNAQDIVPFENFKSKVRTTWANGDYPESIELLQTNKDHYLKESEQHTIIYYLGLLYLEIDEYQRSFEIFEVGFKQHFFFSLWPRYLSKIQEHPNGNDIIQQNEINKALFQKKSVLKYEVKLPENYNPKLEYSILYFLHGNNSNLDYLKNKWRNITLSTDLIVVLVQSPYPRSNYTFDWADNNSDSHIIQKMHLEILERYSIDSTKIIMSGFSNGGRKAIDLFNNQTLPITGFVVFNPSKPKSNTDTYKATELSGRGAIITGEKDYLLSKQIAMANTFLSESFPLRLVVLPNHGHDYPYCFEEEINNSIDFILMSNK